MERLPGFRDFYPEPVPTGDVWSADVRSYVFAQWRSVAIRSGFREYDGPPLEPLELYTMKSGDEIVGQLYNFVDKGERAVAMRPEMTPTLARMAGAYERNYKKPLKWFAIPQLFRYERQQKGRLREHFQYNADLMGEGGPSADAELIGLLVDVLRSFGLTEEDFVVRLSSRNAWRDFFSKRCQDASKEYAFYQIVDKLERETPEESAKKLSALGFSHEEVQQFIQSGTPTEELAAILQILNARGLGGFIKIDYGVIRGLAYYTGVVFEAFDRKGVFRAIAGGGRYDHLIELITHGKVKMAAAGFGMGDVVLTELLKERKLLPACKQKLDVFCLIEDESLRPQSLKLIQVLRDANISTDYCLSPLKTDKQFKRAMECGAVFTARLVPATDGVQSVIIKNLANRQETTVPTDKAAEFLKTANA